MIRKTRFPQLPQKLPIVRFPPNLIWGVHPVYMIVISFCSLRIFDSHEVDALPPALVLVLHLWFSFEFSTWLCHTVFDPICPAFRCLLIPLGLCFHHHASASTWHLHVCVWPESGSSQGAYSWSVGRFGRKQWCVAVSWMVLGSSWQLSIWLTIPDDVNL